MAFERIKAEIDVLLGALQEKAPLDRYELYAEIMQKLNQLKAYGMPLPADLVELEHRLEREFAAERREASAERRGPQVPPAPADRFDDAWDRFFKDYGVQLERFISSIDQSKPSDE